MVNELEEYLDIDIENDAEILEILKCETPILEVIAQDHTLLGVIDLRSILQYIKDWNEEYCQAHDLCPECRSKLVETFQDVPYGDSTTEYSEGLSCSVCG